MDKQTEKAFLKMQKNEITEHYIYSKIANKIKDKNNKNILLDIAKDELKHYNTLKKITKQEVAPAKLKVHFYYFVSIVFGLSFGLKLMEKGEELASQLYSSMSKNNKALMALSRDEQTHEKSLLNLIAEERLEYAGSIILGLNDALVELTGALAGLTLALHGKNDLIALSGLVTGVAASLSMAASGYLSSKEEADQNEVKSPVKAAVYTGTAYIITVILLIFPYFLGLNSFIALGITLCVAVTIICVYTFYITTAKGLKFFKRFIEMAIISLAIAAISFFAGLGLKTVLGVDV
ncbi:MAG: VIT1/CCC1 transporter family protein [Spirochaetales bacterium]|nr:VIT1/CCC1 transporter family protein [Spirochaetales bacterium]